MIEKIDINQFAGLDTNSKCSILYAFVNEFVDAVNRQQIDINNHECRLLDLQNQINELKDKDVVVEPAENVQDKFAEQRKWIGKACWFWDGNAQTKAFGQLRQIDPLDDGQNVSYQTNYGQWYEHCEPANDDIIYHGE